jgi:hypothetical protein
LFLKKQTVKIKYYMRKSIINEKIRFIGFSLITLAYKVNPLLTKDDILTLLWDSGTPFRNGRMINPVGFIEVVKNR